MWNRSFEYIWTQIIWSQGNWSVVHPKEAEARASWPSDKRWRTRTRISIRNTSYTFGCRTWWSLPNCEAWDGYTVSPNFRLLWFIFGIKSLPTALLFSLFITYLLSFDRWWFFPFSWFIYIYCQFRIPFVCRLFVFHQITERDLRHISRLSDRLLNQLRERIPSIVINGDEAQRYPGNLNVSFAYVEGESLLMALRNIAISSGSACTSASLEPSYVLRALGVDEELAHTSLRFGIGRWSI